ncbi:MAG: Beta-lactamase class C-like and penicillin binding proteins (PBPs) superfamily [Cytophagales bacterium]|jgi:CubicO group peptidase (beta-lactamase class C family)|nr:beta-lactamase family protein [Bacteroidota bacterium]MBS1981063.1 beta-lactamase family protein [Bacteroidota bacterium]WHZ08425.1 MAG: Beta-lactamase class C-like and penicillin binding proteins (PBPs) superfamily [Cytophagales bacterium]
MKKVTALFIAIVSFAGSVIGQKNLVPGKPEENGVSPERLTRIDNVLNNYVLKEQLPGAVALIVRNGKIVYEKSFGFADVEKKITLKTNHIFRIASQSKAITSLAVMMLWEQGKFLLDEPISKYIPEFKDPKVLVWFNDKDSTYSAQPAKSEITIRQLLTHTSGIDYAAIGSKEFRAIYAKAGIPSGIGIRNTDVLGDKIKILGKLPLKHNPGEQWTYGLNSDVLGYLVEVLSGMTFENFLREKIFKPLEMNDTYFYLPKEKQDRLVTLYEVKGGKVSPPTVVYDGVNPDYPKMAGHYYSGGAGLSSTVADYAKFLQLFLNKGEYNGVRLLSRKTVELMLTEQLHSPLKEKFGLGFGLETPDNDYVSPYSVGTFSWGGAFSTLYWADPKEKLIGIIYTNIYNSPFWTLGEKYKALVYQSLID